MSAWSDVAAWGAAQWGTALNWVMACVAVLILLGAAFDAWRVSVRQRKAREQAALVREEAVRRRTEEEVKCRLAMLNVRTMKLGSEVLADPLAGFRDRRGVRYEGHPRPQLVASQRAADRRFSYGRPADPEVDAPFVWLPPGERTDDQCKSTQGDRDGQ